MATVWNLVRESTYYKTETASEIDFVNFDIIGCFEDINDAFEALAKYEESELFSGGLTRVIGSSYGNPHRLKVSYYVHAPRELQ